MESIKMINDHTDPPTQIGKTGDHDNHHIPPQRIVSWVPPVPNHGLARRFRAMAAGLRGAALEHGDAADLEIRGAGHHLPLCGGGIFEAWTMLGV